jgi:hypothetical protein
MKRLILAIIAIVATAISTQAQPLRIGERLPTIDVDSSVGSELKLIEEEYTCIIFMHSASKPTLKAIKSFSDNATAWRNELAVVLITPEQDGFEQEVLNSFTTNDTIVAFDNNYHTFESFDVQYIPFGVIYNTRTRRVLWFGSLPQLSVAELQEIIESEN